jgi:hypothetical protein
MADAYDDSCDDETGELGDSYDLLDSILHLMAEANILTSCSDHGWWANFRDNCPACEWCDQCQTSPCDGDHDDEDEEDQ